MTNIYANWDSDYEQEKFSKPRDFFRSEKYFLSKIAKSGMSILDIGCGCGTLYHGLKDTHKDIRYVGVDISKGMVESGKKLASDMTFILGNFLEDSLIEKDDLFDLTFATGVFQHEPETEKLLRNMLDHTKDGGYCMFDTKLFHTNETLRNIEKSYSDVNPRMYFIVYYLNDLLNIIFKQKDVVSIEIYGYYSGTHESIHLPESVDEKVCSANILLKRGERNLEEPFSFNVNLPVDFLEKYGKKT